jgi:hypothetical protein
MASGPASIVPTPAAQFPGLRGRRVIVGVPGLGFRGDLRADNAVVQGSRTYVPILTEQDFYRAEIEQIEAFAPLVPIDRVWVEHIPEGAHQGENGAVTLDAPPRRDAVPAGAAMRLIGRRLVQAVPDGYVRDLRAVTDIYADAVGGTSVRICAEAEWYRWALTGTVPTIEVAAASTLWLE